MVWCFLVFMFFMLLLMFFFVFFLRFMLRLLGCLLMLFLVLFVVMLISTTSSSFSRLLISCRALGIFRVSSMRRLRILFGRISNWLRANHPFCVFLGILGMIFMLVGFMFLGFMVVLFQLGCLWRGLGRGFGRFFISGFAGDRSIWLWFWNIVFLRFLISG